MRRIKQLIILIFILLGSGYGIENPLSINEYNNFKQSILKLRTNESSAIYNYNSCQNNNFDSTSTKSRTNLGIFSLEWLGATAGGLGFGTTFGFVAQWLSQNADPDSKLGIFALYGSLGYIVGSTLGTTIIARLVKQKGNFISSLIWGTGGDLLSWGIGWTIGPSPWVYIFVVPQSFSVLGYNLRGSTCCGIGKETTNNLQIAENANESNYKTCIKVQVTLIKYNY